MYRTVPVFYTVSGENMATTHTHQSLDLIQSVDCAFASNATAHRLLCKTLAKHTNRTNMFPSETENKKNEVVNFHSNMKCAN